MLSTVAGASLPMLDQLIQQLERRAGSAALAIHRPRPRDWVVTMFRDHPRADRVIYFTGHGDTLTDAVANLLADPAADARGIV